MCQPFENPKLVEKVVNLATLDEVAEVFQGHDAAFCCLGKNFPSKKLRCRSMPRFMSYRLTHSLSFFLGTTRKDAGSAVSGPECLTEGLFVYLLR